MVKYWYRVDLIEGEKTRFLVGTSDLDLPHFAQALSGQAFLRLGDLSYRDNQNRIVSFASWDPRLGDEIYFNPRYVISVMPFTGDPRSRD